MRDDWLEGDYLMGFDSDALRRTLAVGGKKPSQRRKGHMKTPPIKRRVTTGLRAGRQTCGGCTLACAAYMFCTRTPIGTQPDNSNARPTHRMALMAFSGLKNYRGIWDKSAFTRACR